MQGGITVKKYYKMLYEAFEGKTYRCNKKRIDFTQLGYSNPFCGEKYFDDVKECKLMLVGRATNGWDVKVSLESASEFAEDMERKINRQGFDWVRECEGGLCAGSEEDPYLLSRSAFWRTAKSVWSRLSRLEEVRWVENIVWSNLYKVAPKDFGNPTTGMCRTQQVICKNLLREEIELYKPTHILLVTGWDWIEWGKENSFISIFEETKQTDEKYVVGTAYYKLRDCSRIPIVITNRPECLKNDKYVDEVLRWFAKI